MTVASDTLERDRLMDETEEVMITKENMIMKSALEEIRDVANISEGVQFYAMVAEKALEKCRNE